MRAQNWKRIVILAFTFSLLCCGAASAQATITGISPTSGPVGAPVTIMGSGFGASQGSSTVALNGTTALATSWSDSTVVAVVPAGATTGAFTVTVNSLPASSSTFTVTTLPSGWTDQDIGTVGLAGSGSYATGAFTLNGAGAGIGGLYGYTSDAFHFDYQSLSGDGTVVARIVNTSNSNAYAGIMIRETLNANSKSMFIGTLTNFIYTMYRTTTGGSPSNGRNSGTPGLPYWVKLVRSGSSFAGYQSLDGLNWVQVGTSQTISMAQSVYVGLAVSSGSTGALYTGTIDSFSVTTTANPAPAITSFSATTGSIGSQVVISGTGFGTSAGSGVVLFNNNAATVSAWSATSITATVPAGATTGPLVVSLAPGMNDSNQVDFAVTSTPLPSGWLDQDVGIVYKAGTAGYVNDEFTIQTASTGVSTYSSQDAFHFVYQSLSGDGAIVARVVNYTNYNGQVGVMIRETMDPSAKTVFVETATNIFAYYRTLSGTTASYFNASISFFSLPYWVKVQRNGSGFTVFYSPDGFDWTAFGSLLDINMAQNVYVGLAVGGGQATSPYTGYFDNVSITSSSITPPVITGLSTTTGPAGTQVVISGSGFAASQGSSTVVLNDSPVTINSWSASSITITIPSTATSGPISVQVAPGMESSNAIGFTVTSTPLPTGWLDADIGQVGKTGSASYANGVFTVQGSGTFLANYADAIHFVYQPMSTSGSVIARVTGAGSGGAYVAAVIRETLDANAANVSAGGYVSTSSSATSYYRSFIGGYELTAGSQGLTLPYWLMVGRSANQFTAYASQNGTTWIPLGTTRTITTAQTVYVGFGVGSNSYSSLDSATFDNVSVSLGASLPNPVVTGISPLSGAPGTSVTISGSGFGATQGTSTVSFNGATATTITSWSDAQIVAAAPDGSSTGPIMVTVGGITGQSSTLPFPSLCN